MNMKKRDILQVEIVDYAFGGQGIAKIDKDGSEKKYVVFVDGAYPGDIVDAQLRKIKSSYAEAKNIKTIKASKYRRNALCKHFGVCGGCKCQDLKYEVQKEYKNKQVIESFEKLGNINLEETEVMAIAGCENEFRYRNKVEFSFAPKKWITDEEIASGESFDREFALGFHIPRMFDKVLNIDECHLVTEFAVNVMRLSYQFFKDRNITIYDTFNHEGYLRNLVIRTSMHTSDRMVNIVTSEENDKLMEEYKNLLLESFPEITTIVNSINAKKALVATGDYHNVLYGTGYIYDYIGKYKFRISPNSFFQTNTLQAEKLYETTANFGEFSKDEIVYDLFCGAGTISLYISEFCKKVYGFEVVKSATDDAEINKDLNNITNTEFINFDLNKSLIPTLEEQNIPKADVLVIDPPRSGMHPKTVKDVIEINPKRIVYVSCNPTTQARDVKLLIEAGYRLRKLQAVDMFPQTYHIENVVLLSK